MMLQIKCIMMCPTNSLLISFTESIFLLMIEQNNTLELGYSNMLNYKHTPTLLYYGLGSPLGKHIGLG